MKESEQDPLAAQGGGGQDGPVPTDIRIVLPNRPGAVTHVCSLVAEAGINVLGACGDLRPGERWGFIHLVVEEGGAAKGLIEGAGYEVTSARPVEMVDLVDEPGGLAKVLSEYSKNNTNIDIIYTASNDRLVIGTEDMLEERMGMNVEDVKGA
ncbi:MAG: hypothetical protein QOG04_2155 [Actinomycetota bacterium]|jgi:hypothetical protein|nr:hypothetical protein [Actinomycetota bacterium]